MQVVAIGHSRFHRVSAAHRRGIVALLARWHRRATTRAALRELPPWLLRDVGLTSVDAAHEAARPFWKP